MAVTLKDCMNAMIKTKEVGATPHRDVYWEKLTEEVALNEPVDGVALFIEEYNTGYNGVLERWLFKTKGRDGEEVSFWLDLIPGLFETA